MTLLDILPSLVARPPNGSIPRSGRHHAFRRERRLCVGGVPLSDIADEFHTPAYVIDETDFRTRARRYRRALRVSRSSMPENRC